MNRIVAALLVAAACLQAPALAQQTAAPPAAGAGGPVESQVLKPSDFPGGKAEIPSFQRGSPTRAGGPANELNTGDERAEARLGGGSVADALTGKDLYHGNHCGMGTRGKELAPTDELDASCQRHDACYEKAGGPTCECDRALRREALSVSTTVALSRELRSRALSVAEAAELMACKGR